MVLRRPFNTQGGTVFPPPGSREGGARVDFRADLPFGNQVEWHGVQWAWIRMTRCPCKPLNNQTGQADPDCPKCDGNGWASFRTPGYFLDPAKVRLKTEVQKYIVEHNNAMVINGIPMATASQPNIFSALGNWALGSVLITFRPENKIGYYDRLVHLDDVIPFSEVFVQGTSDTVKLRYPADAINGLLTETKDFDNTDIVLENGDIKWLPGKQPSEGTRVSVHYLHHPVFRVVEFPHLSRLVKFRKKPPSEDATPMGDPMPLPIQVLARLEFLPTESQS